MADAFATLCRGARFTAAQKVVLHNTQKAAEDTEVDQHKVVRELDFFANTARQAAPATPATDTKTDDTEPTKKKKKRGGKRRRKSSGDDHHEDGADTDEHTTDGQVVDHQAEEAEAQVLREMMQITCDGPDPPLLVRTFDEFENRFHCPKWLTTNVQNHRWTEPTAVQMQSISAIATRRDCLIGAPTGSGKTGAYLLPILHLLKSPSPTVGARCLIIVPVHELAQQIQREANQLAQNSGIRVKLLTKANARATEQKYDVMITTPLRLVGLIREQSVDLNTVSFVVFDEADKLFEMGFLEQVDEILAACTNPQIVRCLFSATIPKRVEELARTILRHPLFVVVGKRNAAVASVEQKLVYVGGEEGKILAVRQLLQQGGCQPPILIFVESKERAKELFRELVYDNINVDVIHADRTLAQRESIVDNFRLGKLWVLITTDVLGRGVDFKGVNVVINFDFPNSITSYIHRIGRTGRAGHQGKAFTLFTNNDVDMSLLRGVANVIRNSGGDVPDWMLKLSKPKQSKRRHIERTAAEREHISTVPKYLKKIASHKRQIVEQSKQRKQRLQQTE
eukprot:c1635_g1_i2.p1 GENE.c1635_g1_i2~~c1635_g1_i2.p1  ORF type:complete len:567 (-),score=146.50 c1635_g1_i2:47-1747(-)